jgi:hypothetical protein
MPKMDASEAFFVKPATKNGCWGGITTTKISIWGYSAFGVALRETFLEKVETN